MTAISPDVQKLEIYRVANGWIVSHHPEDSFARTSFVAETPNILAGLIAKWASSQDQPSAMTGGYDEAGQAAQAQEFGNRVLAKMAKSSLFAASFVTDAVPLADQAKTYMDPPLELKVPDYQPDDAHLPLQDNA